MTDTIADLRRLLAAAFPDGGAAEVMAATLALVDAAPALLDVAEAARESLVFRTSTDGSAESAAGRLQAALRKLDETGGPR